MKRFAAICLGLALLLCAAPALAAGTVPPPDGDAFATDKEQYGVGETIQVTMPYVPDVQEPQEGDQRWYPVGAMIFSETIAVGNSGAPALAVQAAQNGVAELVLPALPEGDTAYQLAVAYGLEEYQNGAWQRLSGHGEYAVRRMELPAPTPEPTPEPTPTPVPGATPETGDGSHALYMVLATLALCGIRLVYKKRQV